MVPARGVIGDCVTALLQTRSRRPRTPRRSRPIATASPASNCRFAASRYGVIEFAFHQGALRQRSRRSVRIDPAIYRNTARTLAQSEAAARSPSTFDGAGCAALTGSDAGKLSIRPASSFAWVSRSAAAASRGLTACLSCAAGSNFSAMFCLHRKLTRRHSGRSKQQERNIIRVVRIDPVSRARIWPRNARKRAQDRIFFAKCSIWYRQGGATWGRLVTDEIAPSSSLRCSKDKIPIPARLEFRIWNARQTRSPGWRTVREGLERRDDVMFPASDRRDRSGWDNRSLAKSISAVYQERQRPSRSPCGTAFDPDSCPKTLP